MLSSLNFYPLEVVSRCRDPQLQVGKNYFRIYILNQNIYHSSKCYSHLYFTFSCLRKMKSLQTAIDVIDTLTL